MHSKSLSRVSRTRVTTGKQLFLERVDERSLVARRYREVLGSLVSDLGGPDSMSEAELIIARRAASLVVVSEQYESRMAEGGKLDLESYMPVVNTLARLLTTLGLKRRPKQVGPSPLEGYHAANAVPREPDAVDAEPMRDEPAPRRINEAIAAVAAKPDCLNRSILFCRKNVLRDWIFAKSSVIGAINRWRTGTAHTSRFMPKEIQTRLRRTSDIIG